MIKGGKRCYGIAISKFPFNGIKAGGVGQKINIQRVAGILAEGEIAFGGAGRLGFSIRERQE
jgi:hypothetical protein